MDKDDVYIHNGILLSRKKKEGNSTVTWMELEIIKRSEVSQTEKDKYHMVSFLCGI